jgi:hypothetical protein
LERIDADSAFLVNVQKGRLRPAGSNSAIAAVGLYQIPDTKRIGFSSNRQ